MNVGPQACSVAGAWQVVGARAGDAKYGPGNFRRRSGTAAAAVVAPGQAAELTVSALGACPGAGGASDPVIDDMTLLPPQATSTLAVRGLNLDAYCGDLQLSDAVVDEPQAPLPQTPLVATLASIDDAGPGQTLNYVIRLTNTGATTYTFGECPVYTEGVYLGAAYRDSEYLNCAGVSIEPNSYVDFAMQMLVPQATGTAKFGWTMDGGLAVGRTIAVG